MSDYYAPNQQTVREGADGVGLPLEEAETAPEPPDPEPAPKEPEEAG